MNKNLENLLEELLKNGKVRKQATYTNYLNGLLNSAHHNFLAAKYTFDGGFMDTAFKSALVAGAFLGKEFEELIAKIDRYRIKRNNAVYQPIDFISKSEAGGILKSAKDFWVAAKKYLKENNKQLELFDF